jgi:MazG family protein
MTEPADIAVSRLLAIMRRLRDPAAGCPWDREQTFATIAPYTIEEAYEVADAIQRDDLAALKDELGDLLFQVVFHARMAEEAHAFAFTDVVDAICAKMERRHPHVFGAAEQRGAIASAADQTAAWERHKERERAQAGPAGTLDGVPTALPATTRAVKLQRRAARVGFDWPDAAPVVDKVAEELDEVRREMAGGATRDRLEEELGDLLFACTNLARHLDIDPENALRQGNAKFERRFRWIERRLADEGKTPDAVDLGALEALWQEAKRAETE